MTVKSKNLAKLNGRDISLCYKCSRGNLKSIEYRQKNNKWDEEDDDFKGCSACGGYGYVAYIAKCPKCNREIIFKPGAYTISNGYINTSLNNIRVYHTLTRGWTCLECRKTDNDCPKCGKKLYRGESEKENNLTILFCDDCGFDAHSNYIPESF